MLEAIQTGSILRSDCFQLWCEVRDELKTGRAIVPQLQRINDVRKKTATRCTVFATNPTTRTSHRDRCLLVKLIELVRIAGVYKSKNAATSFPLVLIVKVARKGEVHELSLHLKNCRPSFATHSTFSSLSPPFYISCKLQLIWTNGSRWVEATRRRNRDEGPRWLSQSRFLLWRLDVRAGHSGRVFGIQDHPKYYWKGSICWTGLRGDSSGRGSRWRIDEPGLTLTTCASCRLKWLLSPSSTL